MIVDLSVLVFYMIELTNNNELAISFNCLLSVDINIFCNYT